MEAEAAGFVGRFFAESTLLSGLLLLIAGMLWIELRNERKSHLHTIAELKDLSERNIAAMTGAAEAINRSTSALERWMERSR